MFYNCYQWTIVSRKTWQLILTNLIVLKLIIEILRQNTQDRIFFHIISLNLATHWRRPQITVYKNHLITRHNPSHPALLTLWIAQLLHCSPSTLPKQRMGKLLSLEKLLRLQLTHLKSTFFDFCIGTLIVNFPIVFHPSWWQSRLLTNRMQMYTYTNCPVLEKVAEGAPHEQQLMSN